MTIVELCVHMDCAGCERKIRKALRKLEGVDDVDVDMGMQKVTVTGYVDQKKVLKAVRKTGRRAVLWPYPYGGGAGHHHNYYYYYQQSNHHPALAAQRHNTSFNGGGSSSRSLAITTPFSSSSSSYNYYKHGYDDSQMHVASQSSIVGERAGDIFSDENPNACSVM